MSADGLSELETVYLGMGSAMRSEPSIQSPLADDGTKVAMLGRKHPRSLAEH